MATMQRDFSKISQNMVGESTLEDVNTFVQNHFEVSLSNFPNFTNVDLDLSVITSNIKSFSVPELTMSLTKTYYTHYNRIEINTSGDRDWPSLSFKILSDGLLYNWYLFREWIINSRRGNGVNGNNFVHDNCIAQITIFCSDNTKKVRSKLIYRNCFLTSLSSMELEFGTANNYLFDVSFECESMDFEIVNEEEK